MKLEKLERDNALTNLLFLQTYPLLSWTQEVVLNPISTYWRKLTQKLSKSIRNRDLTKMSRGCSSNKKASMKKQNLTLARRWFHRNNKLTRTISTTMTEVSSSPMFSVDWARNKASCGLLRIYLLAKFRCIKLYFKHLRNNLQFRNNLLIGFAFIILDFIKTN